MKFRIFSVIENKYIDGRFAIDLNGNLIDLYNVNASINQENYLIEEATPFFDKNGIQVFVGDVVRHFSRFNDNFHGSYVDYVIIKRNGEWINEYLISENGQVIPVGYTAGIIRDSFCEEYTLKSLVFYDNPNKNKFPKAIIIGNIHEMKQNEN